MKKLEFKTEWLEEKDHLEFLIEITDKINEIIQFLDKNETK